MNSIEETAQSMSPGIKNLFGKVSSVSMTVFQALNAINSIKSKLKVKSSEDDVILTGQFTDIAYADTGQITECRIKEICGADKDRFSAVMNNYNQAVKEGYLDVNPIKNPSDDSYDFLYTTTEKGKEYINSEAFKEQFVKDREYFLCNKQHKNSAFVKLTGTKQDINIFRYIDSFNINALQGSNTSQIKSLLEHWQKYGFVNIDVDGNVTATEKCLRYFHRQDIKGNPANIDITKITPENLNNIAEKIKASKESAKQAVKIAASEAGKKAVAEGTKAAAKVGASTVAGASTAGVATAATVVVELSKKGVKILENSMQMHSSIAGK